MSESLSLLFQLFLGTSIVGLTYYIGRLIFSFWFCTIDEHIFLGFGKRLFGFRFKGINVSVGLFIPLPWLAKIDAVVDGERHKLGLPWEFHQTPLWKRLIATFGGVVISIVVGVLVFIVLAYQQKDTFYSRQQTIDIGIYPGEIGKNVGFEIGDKVLKLNGQDYTRFSDLISPEVINSSQAFYTVLRGTDTINVTLNAFESEFSHNSFIQLNHPFEVGMILEFSSADIGGLKPGDKILKVNGNYIQGFYEFEEFLQTNTSDSVKLTITRSEELIEKSFLVSEDGKIGFSVRYLSQPEAVRKSIPQAIYEGTGNAFSLVFMNILAFRKMIVGNITPTKSISGPIQTATIFGNREGINWIRFWRITGLLMMVNMLYNLLPIPKSAILEVFPLIYELFSKKPMNTKTYRKIKLIPFIFILVFMVFVVFNDIRQLY